MRAILALVKKEAWELLGDRYARRGGFLQAAIFTLLLGVFLPLSGVAQWQAAAPMAIFFYAFFPGVAAATIAADAFAGERERRTLETLLATPLSESTILLGKLFAAVGFGFSVAVVSVIVATISINVSAGAFVPSPTIVLGALGAAFASATLMASVAIVISMLIPAQRPAQQVTTLSSTALLGLVATLWKSLHLAITWTNVFVAEAALVVVAVIVLEVARGLFRRDRFFRES